MLFLSYRSEGPPERRMLFLRGPGQEMEFVRRRRSRRRRSEVAGLGGPKWALTGPEQVPNGPRTGPGAPLRAPRAQMSVFGELKSQRPH